MAGIAAESGDKTPAELTEWVHKLMHGGAIPLFDFHHCSYGWASPPGDTFLVRGPSFLETKAKVPAGEWLLHPLAFDWLQSPSKISKFMQHRDCRVRAALDAAIKTRNLQPDALERDPVAHKSGNVMPFVWAFNLQLCNKENHSLVVYYVSFHLPSNGSLMQRFLDGDDAFRSSRLKVITRIAEGPWIVKAVVGDRWPVCMVGKILKCTYTKEEHYIEVDVDAGSSVLTRPAMQLSIGLTPYIIMDVAFVLEGLLAHELPERVLGATRFAKLHLSSATCIDSYSSVTDANKAKSYTRSMWDSLRRVLHGGDQEVAVNEKEKQ